MRKVLAAALLLGALSAAFVGAAHADDFLGQLCWQKLPFDDVVKLEISKKGSFGTVHGAQFSSTYSFPFSGTLYLIGGQVIIGGTFTGDLDGSHFNASVALSETAVLSLASGSGPGVMTGIDGKFTPSQTTWTLITCPPGPTTHDEQAPGASTGERRQGG